MLSADSQLRRIEALLLGTGGIPGADATVSVDPWDLTGELTLDCVYASGHRLAVLLTIDVSFGYPHWAQYSFHLEDVRGRLVFRYDNAPHHHEISTFPHHKHVRAPAGRSRVLPHPQPSLGEVLREIVAALDDRARRAP